jgi:hypothetical protein
VIELDVELKHVIVKVDISGFGPDVEFSAKGVDCNALGAVIDWSLFSQPTINIAVIANKTTSHILKLNLLITTSCE